MTSETPTQLNLALTAGQSFFQSVWWKDANGNTIPLTGLDVTWTVRINDRVIRKDRSTLVVDDPAGRVELALSSSEVDYFNDTETFWGVTKLVIQDPLGPFYRVATGYVFRPGSFGEDFLLMGTSTDIQVFTSNGTWTKPAGAVAVMVRLIGGGAGGGSGRRGAAGTVRCGGGGGNGGAITSRWLNPTDLGATEPVTVGAGGNGGAAQGTNDTDGNSGAAGGESFFGSPKKIATATSNAAVGGSATGGAGGVTYQSTAASSAGAGTSASATGGVGPSCNPAHQNAGGGAAGGGITSGNSASNGGAAARSCEGTDAGTYTGGIAGGAGPVSGTDNTIPGGGGGGGSGGAGSTTGAGQNGNNGRLYGGGGGGGGASVNGSNSGAGGNGAAGVVVVYTIVQT